MMKIKGCVFLICSFLLCPIATQAFSSCTFRTEPGDITATKSFTMPISGIISVPPDTPVGKELYRQNINLNNQNSTFIDCTTAGQYYVNYNYLATPITPPTYSSVVYNTNIPGIGIKFSTSAGTGGDFPLIYTATNCPTSKSCGWSSGFQAPSWFSLIKTANTIVPGALSASSLPSVVYSLGQSGAMVDIYKINLSGSLQITVPTCNITLASQSMTVNMGKYDIAAFTGKGATTQWKNASIQLTNCGQFYGNSQGGNTMATFDGSAVTYYNLNNNFLSITLTPLNGIEDPSKGIMKIKEQPLKASGVGIQLSASESTSGLVNFASAIIQSLPKDGNQSITVPLYARYIQTADSVEAGKADGRLEYVITYQ